jgi:predicted CoA-substrate-specific enzyme activase
MKHQAKDITIDGSWKFTTTVPVVGLDIGSRGSKGVLLNGDEVVTVLIPTGLYMQETADELLTKLLQISGLERSDIGFIVGTGYGRISLKYDDIPYQVVTEISCHAMGAHALVPKARTIIDIGGQDSKAIKVDTTTGKVVEFVMNDKCAAGTGRFLEKAASILGIDLRELGAVALKSKNPAQISSQCAVFAESEVISLRARGVRDNNDAISADIAAGIHYSTARRVHNLLGRIGIEPDIVFTGGVSNNVGMWKVLEEQIGAKFTPAKLDLIYAGALGAAIHAWKHYAATHDVTKTKKQVAKLDLKQFAELISEEQQSLIDAKDVKKVGYICNYTPVELLSAAGVRHSRLIKAGSAKTVSAGELYTQSVFCDFTKSCIGFFQEGDPFYKSFDKVYNFHTCATMKRASEVIEQFVPTKLLNLPKLRLSQDARNFFREEILNFKDDLGQLTGKPVQDEEVRHQITLYNRARGLLKQISEFRKRADPTITGKEFLDLVRGYYYLPVEKLIKSLEQVHRHLKDVPKRNGKPLRLMISGSVMADGDRRLLDIIEGELGARVVIEDHCAGVRPFYHSVAETGDPYAALANGYLDQAPCARMKPLDDGIAFSGKLAQEYAVDGVIYVFLKFCACYGVSKKDFIAEFKKQGLPVLEISSDYSESDHGQLKTRIEAFVEVLNEKRNTPTKHEQHINA